MCSAQSNDAPGTVGRSVSCCGPVVGARYERPYGAPDEVARIPVEAVRRTTVVGL